MGAGGEEDGSAAFFRGRAAENALETALKCKFCRDIYIYSSGTVPRASVINVKQMIVAVVPRDCKRGRTKHADREFARRRGKCF